MLNYFEKKKKKKKMHTFIIRTIPFGYLSKRGCPSCEVLGELP